MVIDRSVSESYTVVGLVDDDPLKAGDNYGGVRVCGTSADVQALAEELSADAALIAIPSASGSTMRALYAACGGVRVLVLPWADVVFGRNRFRFRDISPEDLLRREPVRLNLPEVRSAYVQKTVLVAGGAGSIGAELVRYVASVGASRVIVLDHHEPGVFATLRMCSGLATEVVPELCDIRDRASVLSVIARNRPHVVLHAAAYKHVPMGEAMPDVYVDNNVRGTLNLVDAALSAGVERFVLISSDKAVSPTSVMGATKRACELVVTHLCSGAAMIGSSVRFGNVLGSSGSVVPIFQSQIESGGPVTITDERMTRYFMSIPEAAQLVLIAGALATGDDTFILDMGEPVRIVDLAYDMCRLAGLEPHRDILFETVGMRPGEKLHEVLSSVGEHTTRVHGKIMRIEPGSVVARPDAARRALVEARDAYDMVNQLEDLLHE